jgi:hypothetical protein
VDAPIGRRTGVLGRERERTELQKDVRFIRVVVNGPSDVYVERKQRIETVSGGRSGVRDPPCIVESWTSGFKALSSMLPTANASLDSGRRLSDGVSAMRARTSGSSNPRKAAPRPMSAPDILFFEGSR